MFVKKHTATKEELRDWVLKFWIQDLGRVVPPPRSTSPVAVAIEDAVAALRAVYTTGRQRFRALVHTATKSTVRIWYIIFILLFFATVTTTTKCGN